MKKTIIILLIALTFVSTIVSASDTPVIPEKLEQSLKENFPGASGVGWTERYDLRIAEFKDNQIKHLAYFDENAKLVAVIRFINTTYMPLKTTLALKNKYGDIGTITALEITLNTYEVFYLIDVIHNNKRQTIKVYIDGSTLVMNSEKIKH